LGDLKHVATEPLQSILGPGIVLYLGKPEALLWHGRDSFRLGATFPLAFPSPIFAYWRRIDEPISVSRQLSSPGGNFNTKINKCGRQGT
jgi:hypothetical protein